MEIAVKQYICSLCEKIFKYKRSLARHEKNVHPNIIRARPKKASHQNPETGHGNCEQPQHKCPLCKLAITNQLMVQHLKVEHDVQLKQQDLEFPNYKEFLEWKEWTEKETDSVFVTVRGKRTSANGTYSYFYCHRSGYFHSKGVGLRKLKAEGSNKIDGLCPAKITVREAFDGKCTVAFLMTHVGHRSKEMERIETLKESVQKLPENIESASKEELISVVRKLQIALDLAPKQSKSQRKNKAKNDGTFDFGRYKKRHVALKIIYLGWGYDGFVVQDNTEETVEAHLFKALLKTKMIEARETSNYHRCGRTDKGVSAFTQVISIDLRSNLLDGVGVYTPENYKPHDKTFEIEMDYVGILNRVLPPTIRVVAWAAVEQNFSARFDCIQRIYKYYFPRSNLNVEKMQEAAKLLIGEHDFRNLCKMDVGNGVVHYVRKIFKVDIQPISPSCDEVYDIMELTVVGSSFLWHQIRCIVAVLILVGQKKEEPKIISQLLDVKRVPQKPQYGMASEIPLVLFDCDYEGVAWVYNETNLKFVISQMQRLWTEQTVKSVIVWRMLEELEKLNRPRPSIFEHANSLLMGVKSRVYKRLLDRPVCDSLEDKIAYYGKKRKLNPKDSGPSENGTK